MKSDHDSQQASDGVRLGGWVDSEGSTSDKRVLEGYLREMGGTERLQPEEETRLAEELRNSRRDLHALFSGLAEPWRTQVLDGERASEFPLLNASREEDEAAYRRLEKIARKTPSEELTVAVVEARRCKARFERARDAMIVANLRLVVRVVAKFKNRGIPLLDLIQEGNLGLIRAVEKFEVERGYRFSTYAIWWIRHGLSKAFSESSRLIRLPANVGMAVRRLRQRRRHLEKTL